jgi:hypothetical protein
VVRVLNNETGLVQDISDEQQRAIIDAGGTVLKEITDGKPSVRLWDNVDGTWAKAIPESMVSWMLDKEVFKCTACSYVQPVPSAKIYAPGRIGGVDAASVRDFLAAEREKSMRIADTHVNNVMERAEQHDSASIEIRVTERGSIHYCTGCGISSDKPMRLRLHLQKAMTDKGSHQGASFIAMHRFALEPSELPVIKPVAVSPDRPEASVVERRQRRRPRGHRRSR